MEGELNRRAASMFFRGVVVVREGRGGGAELHDASVTQVTEANVGREDKGRHTAPAWHNLIIVSCFSDHVL